MLPFRHLALSLALLVSTAPAFAHDEPAAPTPAFTVTGGVTGVSQYRFRGVSLSNEDPAIQGTINLNHSSGFYAGAWASSLDGFGELGGSNLELDLYAGYGREIGGGVKVDGGLLYYAYPGSTGGDFEFFEPYLSVTAPVGPGAIKVGAAYAPKQDAIGDEDNLYLYADPSISIPNTPVTLKAHLGRSMGDSFLTFSGQNYWDWMVGADVKLIGPLTAGVAYVDTSLKSRDLGFDSSLRDQVDSAVVFSLSASF